MKDYGRLLLTFRDLGVCFSRDQVHLSTVSYQLVIRHKAAGIKEPQIGFFTNLAIVFA